ncbi:MAG: putative acyltransferase [Puniceicoccaceae bacterium 5H]|nr:MAG: putative acyltransferase [Puniceicoccaceae bacterium 5H]
MLSRIKNTLARPWEAKRLSRRRHGFPLRPATRPHRCIFSPSSLDSFACHPVKLNSQQSLSLDLVRGISALVVLLHHYSGHIAAHRIFPNLGQEAVIVFFILSGFVISMVSQAKENTFSVFALKRVSRFYSVVPIAVLFILSVYVIQRLADLPTQGHHAILAKLLATFTFLNWNGWHSLFLPSASVFWSLTCEWWYYIMFALWVFIPNRKVSIIAILTCCLIVGLPTVMLAPIWLMGWFAYRTLNKRKITSTTAIFGIAISSGAAFMLWASNWRYTIFDLRGYFPVELSHANYAPYFWLLGVCFSVALVCGLTLLSGYEEKPTAPSRHFIRFLADGSFFLYLVHMPIMLLLSQVTTEPFPYAFPLATGVACLAFGRYVENLRKPLYKFLSHLASRKSEPPAQEMQRT